MKKKLLIGLITFILLVLVYALGLHKRYNIVTGIIDRLSGNIAIVYYGELGPNDKELKKLAEANGFQYIRIAGCAVDAPLVNGASHYNWIMKDHLRGKYPEEFLNKF